MAHQPNPNVSRPEQAPDPATSYERAKPKKEDGVGRLDSPIGASTPDDRHERGDHGVGNRQPGDRQINGQDDGARLGATANQPGHPATQQPGSLPPPEPVDHSMHDEEPTGWDQAPTDIHDPEQKRHPRTEGKGGTP
ncbi:MAG TPA: hypothetical protein VK986_00370 [Tepidisphaeraceae bacterium]|nr:hypothetical protein [Tepidisphaeraceae bacterium]